MALVASRPGSRALIVLLRLLRARLQRGFLARLLKQGRQGLGLEALEHAEVGQRQRAAVKVAQQGTACFAILSRLAGLVGLGHRGGQGGEG